MSLESILRKGKKFVVGGMIAANVLGLYNCDKNPANEISPSEENFGEIEVYTGETDEDGQVDFENDESVYVVNSDNESLEGINVGIVEGEDYSVISSYDSSGNYLPSLKFLNEIDEDTLYLIDSDESNVRTLSSEEDEICFKFLRDSMNNPSLSRSSDCHNYDETISGQDALYGYYAINVLLNGLGAGVLMNVVEGVATLFDLIEEGSLQEHVLNNNWDRYSFLNPAAEGLNIPNPPQIYFMAKSNKPVLTLEELVFDDGLYFRYSGSDQDYYESQVNDLYIEDRTIPCRGSENNDLMLKYTIFRLNGELVLQDSITQNEEFVNISDGAYTLNLELFDDTRFKDVYNDSGVNKNDLENLISNVNFSSLKIVDRILLEDYWPIATNILVENNEAWITSYISGGYFRMYKLDILSYELSFYADFPFNVNDQFYLGGKWNDGFYIGDICLKDNFFYVRNSGDSEWNLVKLLKIQGVLVPLDVISLGDSTKNIVNYNQNYFSFWGEKHNKFDENFNLIEEKFCEDTPTEYSRQFATNGSNFWILEQNEIYEFNSDLYLINITSLEYLDEFVSDITYDNNYIWTLSKKNLGDGESNFYLNKHSLE